jgi:hypothetical protein
MPAWSVTTLTAKQTQKKRDFSVFSDNPPQCHSSPFTNTPTTHTLHTHPNSRVFKYRMCANAAARVYTHFLQTIRIFTFYVGSNHTRMRMQQMGLLKILRKIKRKEKEVRLLIL